MNQNKEWEEELERLIPFAEVRVPPGVRVSRSDIQSFITTLLQKEREGVYSKLGMMRQWLNEDRITDPKKMVTTDELKVWLDGIPAPKEIN